MIVRVLNVRIAEGRGPEFHAFMRERGLPRMQEHPGLVSVNVGRRTDGPDEFAVIVTVWQDWEALTDALGPDPSRPYMITKESGLAASTTVEHFEAIELPDIGTLRAKAAQEKAADAKAAVPEPAART